MVILLVTLRSEAALWLWLLEEVEEFDLIVQVRILSIRNIALVDLKLSIRIKLLVGLSFEFRSLRLVVSIQILRVLVFTVQADELVVHHGKRRALVNDRGLPVFGDAEVTDLCLTIGVYQHISGLQISMKLFLVLVQVIQTLQ